MLIVTKGKGIVNFDKTEEIYVWPDASASSGGFNIIARGISGEKMKIGWYKSEERAEEVLLEIVEACRTIPQTIAYKMPEA